MPRTTYHGIQLPKLERLPTATVIERLDPETGLADMRIANCDLSGQKADRLVIERTTFQRVLFNQTQLTYSRDVDVQFEVCDLSGSNWEKAHFQRVVFTGCKIFNAQFLEAIVEQVIFKECTGHRSVFALSKLKKTRFEKCDLKEASFVEADLRKTVFQECDLTKADLRGAKLAGADFRSSTIDRLQANPADLAGILIEPTQAIQVVGMLGIKVLSIGESEEENQ